MNLVESLVYPWLEPAWQVFTNRLSAGRMPHALLVHGPEGTGKSVLARDMAVLLLCLEPAADRACGACRSCQLLAGGAHPDRFVLQPPEDKHQIRVDDVRDVIQSLGLTTTISPRKVALVEPAESMNQNSANALLKSLEEPPGDAVILLVAHDPSRLPITIRSRCQAVGVAMPGPGVTGAWLTERHGMDPATAAAALAAAGGSPLRAVAMHQQGLLEAHQGLQRALPLLRSRPEQLQGLAAGLDALEPDTLWLWLSSLASEASRAAAGRETGLWVGDGEAVLPGARSLLRLQRLADRNRQLAKTGVRKDLLLRDWLIKWCGDCHIGG